MITKSAHISLASLLKIAVLLTPLLTGTGLIAQAQKTTPGTIAARVDQAASYPGGLTQLYAYLAKTIHYPAAAREQNVQGKVFLTFVVEKDGSLTNIQVKKGAGAGLNEEAVRAIAKSPKWIPAKLGNKAVRSQYTLPVSFQLDNSAAIKSDKPAEKAAPSVEKPNDAVASFPGGMQQLYAYLAKTVRYPAAAREKNVQGKVLVSFVVEDDGALTDVQVTRGIGSGCDEEALKAMQNSPKWVPAKVGGEYVKQEMVVPINFSLAKG